MPGPLPKNPATRRRQNRGSTAATLPAEAANAQPPALPADRDWHPQTRCWWVDVFASPMASEFLRADIHGLIRLAVLVDDYWQADAPMARKVLAQEIRLQSQCFGLTPIDRRRLQWEVERVEQAREPKRGRTKASTKDDPRVRLAS